MEVGWYRFKEDGPETRESRVETRARRQHVGREVSADYTSKLAIGVWGYTADFKSFRKGNAPQRDKGIYALLDWNIYREPQNRSQGLSVFLRIGVADDDASRFNFYGGSGLVYTGLLPGRAEDELGLSLALARNSRYFQSITPEPLDDFEAALEFTYRTQLTPWLAFQPDAQYVIHPGARQSLKNALVLGTRFELTL